MTINNPNIFFRQNEYIDLYNKYENQYNIWVKEADNYFSSINDWDTFNIMVLTGKYHEKFSNQLVGFLSYPNYVGHTNDNCNAFVLSNDVAYHFSLFQSEPLFYISIFLGIIFIISLFWKKKSLKISLFIFFVLANIGNLINYFIVEKEIIENIKQQIKTENCKESILNTKFEDKYFELEKIEPYRHYGQFNSY